MSGRSRKVQEFQKQLNYKEEKYFIWKRETAQKHKQRTQLKTTSLRWCCWKTETVPVVGAPNTAWHLLRYPTRIGSQGSDTFQHAPTRRQLKTMQMWNVRVATSKVVAFRKGEDCYGHSVEAGRALTHIEVQTSGDDCPCDLAIASHASRHKRGWKTQTWGYSLDEVSNTSSVYDMWEIIADIFLYWLELLEISI